MKITFILPGRGRSGGVKCTVTVANGLIRRGHKVRLLVFGGRFMTRLRDFYLGLRHPGASDWLGLFEGELETFFDINRCGFEEGEIVVASGGWAAEEMTKLKGDRIRKVHYIHGVDSPDQQRMRQIWSEKAPKIIVASYLGKIVRDICGQDVSAVIPNGVDTNEFYPALSADKKDGIGTIFGQSYHKDPATVLKVLGLLKQQCPGVIQRIFGACRKPEQICDRMYVRLPTVVQAREIYSRSLVWFMASRLEGFAVPILEAMACGCAVVATDCGGPRDIITDGENGFIVEAGDAEGIAKKVQLLLENEELRRQFVSRGQETVRKFSWEKSIDKFECALLSSCNQA